MRKPASEVYRRGRFTLGWRGTVAVADHLDANGKRRRPPLGYGLTETQARAALDAFYDAQLLIEAQQAQYKIKDLWKFWMEYRERDKLENGIYMANWVSLAPHFGSRVPDQITDTDWRDYARDRFKAGMSPWTVHTEMTRMWSCLKWAVNNKKLAALPIHWICSRGPSRKRVLTFKEARALIAGAGDHHIFIFILLAFATGARHLAILDLTWDRVDWDANTIQYDEGRPIDPMSKRWTKTRATVPMSVMLRRELKQAKSIAQTKYVVEHGGRRLKTIREGFANAAMRAGLGTWVGDPTKGERTFDPDVTPHTIRHTVNTWLRERGVGAEDRSQLLGHQDLAVNIREYTHASPNILTGAVGMIDEAIAALPQRDVPKRVGGSKATPKKRVLSTRDKQDGARQ